MTHSKLNCDVALHQTEHTLHDQLLQKVAMQALVGQSHFQSLAHLGFQFFNELVSCSHAADTVLVMQGGLIAT